MFAVRSATAVARPGRLVLRGLSTSAPVLSAQVSVVCTVDGGHGYRLHDLVAW